MQADAKAVNLALELVHTLESKTTQSPKVRTIILSHFLLFLILGCGGGNKDKNTPTTVPVSGTVVDRSGKTLKQGNIEFAPVKREGEAALLINGEIQNDGTFNLNTIYGSEKLTGAPEGTYQVTVMTDPKGVVPPATLSKQYTIKAGENLKIQLE